MSPNSRLVQQRLQFVPLHIGQIARVHASNLCNADPHAYHFRDSFPSFWTGSKAEEFSTLVHETAHELLHKAERRTATTKTVRETEAEAVAFVVGKAVGLVTGSASADYIQLYHGNTSLLAESLEVIQQTASIILAALEPPITADAISEELEGVAA